MKFTTCAVLSIFSFALMWSCASSAGTVTLNTDAETTISGSFSIRMGFTLPQPLNSAWRMTFRPDQYYPTWYENNVTRCYLSTSYDGNQWTTYDSTSTNMTTTGEWNINFPAARNINSVTCYGQIVAKRKANENTSLYWSFGNLPAGSTDIQGCAGMNCSLVPGQSGYYRPINEVITRGPGRSAVINYAESINIRLSQDQEPTRILRVMSGTVLAGYHFRGGLTNFNVTVTRDPAGGTDPEWTYARGGILKEGDSVYLKGRTSGQGSIILIITVI
ncbi:UNVERIFIED_ORG: hypothetical protein FHU00_4854 [Citrobacter freundii]